MIFISKQASSPLRIFIYACLFFVILYLVFIDSSKLQAKEKGRIVGGIEHPMPDWFKVSFLDIKDDINEANLEKKHVMLFFHFNGCPYCDRMLNESFSKNGLQSFIQKYFDVIAVNIRGDRSITLTTNVSQTEKELSQRLKVRYTPTILFFDREDNVVVRLNGYRSLKKFQLILRYVKDEAYKKSTLATYLIQHDKKKTYTFRNNPMFKSIVDFSNIKTPLAIIFEDSSCDLCNDFHDKLLTRSDVKQELRVFTIVRLNANSTQKTITNTDGNKVSPRDWVKALKLTYRPGIILFDKGKEIARIDGLLYSFHFKEVFRYVSGQHYIRFTSYNDYLAARQSELLGKGFNINIGNL